MRAYSEVYLQEIVETQGDYYNIPSKSLVQRLPVDFMIAGYRGCHSCGVRSERPHMGNWTFYEGYQEV